MGETCYVTEHVWSNVLQELRAGGAAGAVHQLWLLRRTSETCWHMFADLANGSTLTGEQYRLIACLWELSRERRLEDIAPRLGALPDHLVNSFR